MSPRVLGWSLLATGLLACNAILGNEEHYLVVDRGDAGPNVAAGGAASSADGGRAATGGASSGAGGRAGDGGTRQGGAGGGEGTGGATTPGNGGAVGTGGVPAGTGGTSDTGGAAGASGSGGTAAGGAGAGGSGAGGSPAGLDLEALRASCLSAINGHRLTLGLSPFTRPGAAVEACADDGAEQDAISGETHGSAGECSGMNAQNTCPGWPLPDVENAESVLRACLEQMWEEGPPPVPVSQCIVDPGCFGQHGHYINMTSTSNTRLACGFHLTEDDRLWVNQNFGR